MADTVYGEYDADGNFINLRPRWDEEIAKLEQALASGDYAYGGYDSALNYIYQTYGVPAGVSYQEAQGTIGGLYNTYFPQAATDTATSTDATAPTSTISTGPTAEELAALNTQHKQNLSAIEQAYQNGILTYNEKMAAQEDARNNLLTQRGQGLESNSAYFSNVSPDAFQSQMGNYNQKVLDAYGQGEKTLENNQKSIDYFKNVHEQNYLADKAGENTFNSATGQYSGDFKFTPKTIAAPTFSAVTANPLAQAAKLGIPSWAPNYGGMSVQQAAKSKEDEIQKYLG